MREKRGRSRAANQRPSVPARKRQAERTGTAHETPRPQPAAKASAGTKRGARPAGCRLASVPRMARFL
jgi:hypothetical protein